MLRRIVPPWDKRNTTVRSHSRDHAAVPMVPTVTSPPSFPPSFPPSPWMTRACLTMQGVSYSLSSSARQWPVGAVPSASLVRKQLGTCALVDAISFSPAKSPVPQFVRYAAPASLCRSIATARPWWCTTPQVQGAGEACYVNDLLAREKNFGPSGPKTRVRLLAARRVCAVCG